jgi:CMP-N,N'-diacetyllegionaminic acid synthase
VAQKQTSLPLVLGLIPARGGSKSVPLKNLAPLAGRPLIRYCVAAGRASARVSRLACSTDHPAISRECAGCGVEVIERPAAFATDDAPVVDVIRHALTVLAAQDFRPAMVALLQPTSPFVRGTDIDACVAALDGAPWAQSAQTVTQVEHNSHAFNQRIIEDGVLRFRFREERLAAYNKQRKPKHYIFGNIVVTRVPHLLAGGDCFGENSVAVEIARPYALDVDTAQDFELAEFMLGQGKMLLDPQQ